MMIPFLEPLEFGNRLADFSVFFSINGNIFAIFYILSTFTLFRAFINYYVLCIKIWILNRRGRGGLNSSLINWSRGAVSSLSCLGHLTVPWRPWLVLVWVLRPSVGPHVLLVYPRLELWLARILIAWYCTGRETHRLTACGSACMASFTFDAAVVDSLSVFKFEAVTSFMCVHPDKRIGPTSPNWSLYSAL